MWSLQGEKEGESMPAVCVCSLGNHTHGGSIHGCGGMARGLLPFFFMKIRDSGCLKRCEHGPSLFAVVAQTVDAEVGRIAAPRV